MVKLILGLIGKILGAGIVIGSSVLIITVMAGAWSGIVNMPDEDGGPSIKENWETVALPMLKEGWENPEGVVDVSFLPVYAGSYNVGGTHSYDVEIYNLNEDGTLELKWLAKDNGRYKIKNKFNGYWTCAKDVINIRVQDGDAGWSEKYVLDGKTWNEHVGNKYMNKK